MGRLTKKAATQVVQPATTYEPEKKDPTFWEGVGGFIKNIPTAVARTVTQPVEFIEKSGASLGSYLAKKLPLNLNVSPETRKAAEAFKTGFEAPITLPTQDQPIFEKGGAFESPQQALGSGLEAAVNVGTSFIGGAGVAGVGKGALTQTAKTLGKQAIGKAVTQAEKEVAKQTLKTGGRVIAKNALIDFGAGSLFGTAEELQNPEATPGSIAKSALTGGAISTVATPLVGAGLKGLIKGGRVTRKAFGETLERTASSLERKGEAPVSTNVGERVFEGKDKIPVPLSVKAAEKTARFIRGVQRIPSSIKKNLLDRYSPIGEFQAKARESGIDVPDIHDMAQATGYVATGKAQNRLDDYTNLIKQYGNDWQKVKEASRYLDALDRLSAGNAIEGGHTVQEIKDSLAKLGASLTPEQRININKGARDLQVFLNKELEDAVESGRLNRQQYDQIKAVHPNYIPHDVLDYLDVEVPTTGKGTGKSLQLTKSGIEKAKGSEREIDDIDNAVVRRMFRQQLLNEKNKTMKAIIDAGEKMGEQHGFSRVEGDLKPVDIPKDSEKVSLFRDGKKEEWLVPKELGLAIKNMGGDDANVVMQWLNNSFIGKAITAPASAMRAVATGLNPVFSVFSNPVRDIQTANLTAKALPQDLAMGLLKSINANMRGKTDDELYRLAREAGALQGTLIHEAQREPAKLIASKLSKGNVFSRTLDSNVNPVKLIENLGSTMEEMTRLATFKRALIDGRTPQEAAKIARNSTVDFGKSGYAIQVANKVIPFLNARIQGFSNLGRAILDNPEKAVRVGMITAAYPAALLSAYNTKYESYFNIPDNEKRKYWIIMAGESDGEDFNGNPVKIPHYVKIPKGEAQQAISNVVERALTLSKQKYPETTDQFVKSLIGDISPVTESSLLPAGIQQAIELKSNYSFFRQAPIEPYYTKVGERWYKTEDLEPRFRQKYNTSEIAKYLGNTLNWSPDKIDYIIKVGVLNEIIRSHDLATKGFQTKGSSFEKAAELPAVRSIIGTSSYAQSLKEKEIKKKEVLDKSTEEIKSGKAFEPKKDKKGGRIKK